MTERLWTVPEVADLWAVSTDTVRREISAGNVRHVKVGRLVRIPSSALVAYAKRTPTQARLLPLAPRSVGRRNGKSTKISDLLTQHLAR